jgi:hypothetical protein
MAGAHRPDPAGETEDMPYWAQKLIREGAQRTRADACELFDQRRPPPAGPTPQSPSVVAVVAATVALRSQSAVHHRVRTAEDVDKVGVIAGERLD